VSKICLFSLRRRGKVGTESYDAKDVITLIEFLEPEVSLMPFSPSTDAVAYEEYLPSS
jgi:hypothetical protein